MMSLDVARVEFTMASVGGTRRGMDTTSTSELANIWRTASIATSVPSNMAAVGTTTGLGDPAACTIDRNASPDHA